MTTYAATRAVSRAAGRTRVTVGGVDVSTVYGLAIPEPSYTLAEPFAYGATTLTFPQVHAGYEQAGVGGLSWARSGSRVVISRVFADDSETVDYVGFVISVGAAGRALSLDVGGEFSGKAALLEQQNQLFRYSNDVGHWVQLAVLTVGLRITPWNGPVTGIEVTHAGGQTHLAWASYLGAMSQDVNGLQRALMPTVWGGSTWAFEPKDASTVDLTVFNDDARAVLNVVNDASEAPNVVYGTGITPDGERITNAKWPGVFAGPAPAYPISGGAPFGIGTTNADTIDGSGIETLYTKLIQMGYLPFSFHPTDTYNTALSNGVKALQADAGMTQNGIMSVTAWDRLFDNDVTGYSINGAHIAPLASDPRVEKYLYTSNGSVAGRNPDYDPTVLRVERTIDFGSGITRAAMISYARGIIARSATYKNLAGTLRLNNDGGFWGEHTTDVERAALTSADIAAPRDIRPGMNVWVPDFDGGTLFHIAGCDVDADGVTLTIDTQARDLVEVSAILARDADSRRDVRREWMAQNQNKKPSSAMVACDESFGWIDRKVSLEGGKWNIVPVIAGQHGQVNRVDIRLINDEAEFAVAAFSKEMTRKRLNRKIGDPLVVADESVWETSDIQDWFDDRKILYAIGDGKQPCGYGKRRKLNDAGSATGAPLTGRLIDDSPWAYIAAAHTAVIVYVAIYPDRDCVLKKGRILYPQLDDAA